MKSTHICLFVPLTIALILSLFQPVQTFYESATLTSIEHSSSTGRQVAAQSCLKNWVIAGQKCYKFIHTPRNFENVKNRCRDLSSQVAVIEDESSLKERESSPNPSDPSIINLITFLSTDQKKSEYQTRQYYVTLSQELLGQHHERQLNGFYSDTNPADSYLEADIPISDLWLPRDDPNLMNITQLDKQDQANTAFVLAFSDHYKRWGILPVAPSRRLPFICERPPHSSSNQASSITTGVNSTSANNKPVSLPSDASSPNQSIEAKRDSSGRAAGLSFNFEISHRFPQNPGAMPSEPRRISDDKETGLVAQPAEPPSLLFREIPQDQTVTLGSTAEMRCSALDAESIVGWTYNGNNLTLTHRIKIFPNSTLRIEHVRNTDDGNYTCTIHSGSMTETKVARLAIIERPHQPEYITAELLDKLSTGVRVKWTPGYNGNSPIIKYVVEMRTVESDNVDNDLTTIMQSNLWEVAKANISADQTSVIISDLKPAKKYIFRIRAINKVGTGDASTPTLRPIEVPVQPPSMPPDNLTATPRSSTSIAIQWSPPPVDSQNGVLKGYKIRHKLAGYASDSDWYISDVQDAAHLTYLLDELIAWQTYEIQMAAENDKGIGPYSSSILARTKEGRPAKGPRAVTAEVLGSTKVIVFWRPPPAQYINGVNQGYKIQLWLDRPQTQLAKEVVAPHNISSPDHSATIDNLLPHTDYFITIKCFTNAGDGPPNEEPVVVKTKQGTSEIVQSLEFADILDKSLRVIWRPPKRVNGELDHYSLEYAELASIDKTTLKKFPASTTEALITDLSPQTSYVFKLYPHTGAGQGPGRSNQTTTSVPPVLPEPPTGLTYANVGPNSATIQFTPGFDGNASIGKWIVEALTLGKGEHNPRWQEVYVSTNHSQSNAVIVRNLKPFSRYRLRLRPVNIVGPSRLPSEPTQDFITAQQEPEHAPRDLSFEEIKSNSVVARWIPLADSLWHGIGRGYNITWNENNNATTLHLFVNDTKADSCYIRDLEEFTEYTFRIQAVNEAGSSQPSDPVILATLEDVPSSGPSNLTAHALSSTSVSVVWSSVPRRHRNGIIRGYKIQYQALRSDATIQHKTVEDNATRHITLNDLKPFTTYHLAVAAFTGAGDGVYSSVMNVQTLEATPEAPQNLSFPTVSQTTARVLWDPPEDANGDILGYKVAYHALSDGSKEGSSHELHSNERTFKATNLRPDTHYVFTVTAKTKEGWGKQASVLLYTYDSELHANLPFHRQSWFVIVCACSSIVITIIITALLFVQTKSYKYKRDATKPNHDRLGDAGFAIDDDPGGHYNSGFGLLYQEGNHRRSNGALSQSTANFTLPKTPPRPHPGSVVYSDDEIDEGDDEVFEDVADKRSKLSAPGPSNYDSSGDSLTEKPSEISSSPAPESESADDEYVNMANRHFVNHYANVNGTLRGQKAWKKSAKHQQVQGYSTHRLNPKMPQRPAPSVPQVPNDPMSSSGSDTIPIAGTSGVQLMKSRNSPYGEHSSRDQVDAVTSQRGSQSGSQYLNVMDSNNNADGLVVDGKCETETPGSGNLQNDLLNNNMNLNLNGGRIIVNNMAGSRAPLPGFTSFV